MAFKRHIHPNLVARMVDELKQVVDNEDLLIDFSVDNDLKGFTLEKTVKM